MKVLDCMILLGVLPKTGSYIDMLTAQKAQKKIELTDEEKEKVGFVIIRSPDGKSESQQRDVKKGEDFKKEIEFTKEEKAMIKKELEKLNDGNKLTSSHIGIYEKFVTAKK